MLPEERSASCESALGFPKIGYRKLTWMMVDAGKVCVGESTVYRVLSDADLLSRWKRSAASSVMYVWVAARFYFLVSFVDAICSSVSGFFFIAPAFPRSYFPKQPTGPKVAQAGH